MYTCMREKRLFHLYKGFCFYVVIHLLNLLIQTLGKGLNIKNGWGKNVVKRADIPYLFIVLQEELS